MDKNAFVDVIRLPYFFLPLITMCVLSNKGFLKVYDFQDIPIKIQEKFYFVEKCILKFQYENFNPKN